ncbi:MAG: SpoIID/LytB domain-containing protein [Bacteroidales bacterium]
MKRLFILMFILCAGLYSQGVEVNVRLFTGHKITSLTVGQATGRYLLVSGDQELNMLSHGDAVSFRTGSTGIELIEDGKVTATSGEFYLAAVALDNSLSLRVNGFSGREYEDHLILRYFKGEIRVINRIDLEKYVGGVVQAEAGGSTSLVEFFMVQAIVSRTYAMRLLMRNEKDFYLTDDVANQVYKGKPVKAEILEAVRRTRGEVIFFGDTSLINAVFHSNSGGFTMSSGEVWVSSLPYLQPVVDSFSLGMRNAQWTHRMSTIAWLDYLDKTYGYPVYNDSMKQLALNYTQEQRVKDFHHQIPLVKIRQDLKLKSTFFDITLDNNEVVFTGKGFGHGVGMSQEGAIRMAELGYTPYDILKYYYTDVDIKPMGDLTILASVR